MTLERNLRRLLRRQASEAEPTRVTVHGILHRARRRQRARRTASLTAAAATAAVVVLVPWALTDGPWSGSVDPPVTTSPPGRQEPGRQEPGQCATPLVDEAPGAGPADGSEDQRVRVRFEVRAKNPLEVRGLEAPAPTTFFAALMPLEQAVSGNPSCRIPEPGAGTAYLSQRLRDRDGDGTYSATVQVPPGRYLVTIVVGSGIDRAGGVPYPEPPTRLLLPDGPSIADGAVRIRGNVTFTAVYSGEATQE